MKKLTINFIRKEFDKKGCKLLTKTYKNSKQKLDYICPKGHSHSISWNSFKAGCRCYHCFGLVKLTIEFVRKEFKKEGYKLLTKVYRNANHKLDYVCSKGHKHQMSWHNWQQGHRCPYCSKKLKYNIDDIRKEFKKEGYTLLTGVYKNVFAKLNYICNRGHISSVIWHNWKISGARCIKCKYEDMLMENNPNWKGGISCEPYCQDWTKILKDFIKERDGNRCLNPDCWRNIHKLSVHHIDYNKKNCEPQNLITLCTSCNSRANKDRNWHKSWYKAIIKRRYNYQEITNAE